MCYIFCSAKAAAHNNTHPGIPRLFQALVLDTNASHDGIGAVLSQVYEGTERVVAYASRSLTKAERKHCVTRKELLAVVVFIKQFRPYLLGQSFKLQTNHGSLTWLQNFKDSCGQLARCISLTPSAGLLLCDRVIIQICIGKADGTCVVHATLLTISPPPVSHSLSGRVFQLQEFNFEIGHRRGIKHQNADALSRRPCQQCQRPESECDTGGVIYVVNNVACTIQVPSALPMHIYMTTLSQSSRPAESVREA